MTRWQNVNNPNITAQKAYNWKDRVLILEDYKIIRDITYTEFLKEINNWKPMEINNG